MKTLKVEQMGTEVQGLRLRGDKRSPEPTHVRIVFPGGDVDVARTENGEYWVHVRVDSEEDLKGGGQRVGVVRDTRLDCRDIGLSGPIDLVEALGLESNETIYHLALRVARR